MKAQILCVHLLNDFSGSPLILSQVAEGFLDKNYQVTIFTNQSEGFLSDIEKANYERNDYIYSTNRWITLFRFFYTQIFLFFKFLQYWNKDCVIYINTILPFGPALAGKLMNKKIIYHIHETSVKPVIFKKFLFKMLEWTADEAIYVSHFLQKQEPVKTKTHIIYNALSDKFLAKINSDKNKSLNWFNILMLCSLKKYKGVDEFVNLANMFPAINFDLVLNASQQEINVYFKETKTSTNLTIHPKQKNVHPFYQKAHLVTNLSHPDLWVETFGMTALEAMAYSIPVIVPPVGGIAEIVQNSINGFHIDCRDTNELIKAIGKLSSDESLYRKFSNAAFEHSKNFNISKMQSEVINLVDKANNLEQTSISYSPSEF